MSVSPRGAAVKVIVVYWAMLVFGMMLYTALRIDALDALQPIWVGAIGGTVLGQVLAVQRIRMWLAILVIVSCGIMLLPQLPEGVHGTNLWLAYVPAALCGYWSLGDRTSLAAFWFPAVIWMLSILDGTSANAMPDGTGLVLFAGLAALFVIYLRVREERRVALWRTVAPTPLAAPRPPILLKERPGPQLARVGWAMLVSALGFTATAWLAPRLWQPESFDGGPVMVKPRDPAGQLVGLPCCPRDDVAPVTRARVKEYFDVGRGHDELGEPQRPGIDCRVCRGRGTSEYGYDRAVTPDETYGVGGGALAIDEVPAFVGTGPSGGSITTGMQAGDDGTAIASATPPSTTDRWAHAAPDPGAQPAPYVPPTYAPDPPVVPQPTITPHEPRPVPVEHPPIPAPIATPPPLPPPPPSQIDPPPIPPAPVAAPPPSIAAAHDEPPATAGDAPAPSDRDAPPPPRPPSTIGPLVLHWAAVLVAAALLFQLAALALRPLRRFVTLRHLRRPFWDETVDQRVSNSWQLALVGLRDAGWRTSAAEPPGELARRVNIDGVERCATILERARHGIGIDRDDLAEMTSAADLAYRTARARLGRIARVVAWIRWPLA